MGASGAGKTTFLDIITCKIILNELNGSVMANNKPYTSKTFGDFANYVTQQDILIQTLTVRETLEFVANLKLNTD